MDLMYRDYVRTLADRFENEFSNISAGYNFELGAEFEIALCQVLARFVPTRFGVVRGYLVSSSGAIAGDDIIVFERARFPTIAGRTRDDFSRKEFIPIEAAYAYIEAKHSLSLRGDGPQSLTHAALQVSRVKALVSGRKAVRFGQLGPYAEIGTGMTVSGPEHFPDIKNPFLGIVHARHVRLSSASETLSEPQAVQSALSDLSIDPPLPPDHLVLGPSNIVLPVVARPGTDSGYLLRSPFFLPALSTYVARATPSIAFGISLVFLLQALDWIQLGVMPWPDIIADALGICHQAPDSAG